MITDKVFENYEDFENELRKRKAPELFFSIVFQQADGFEDREFPFPTKADPKATKRYTIAGKRTVATMVLAAKLGEDERAVFSEQVANALIANAEERQLLDEDLKEQTAELVKGLQKLIPSCVITKGSIGLR